jgi:hypothetical protein
MFVLAFAVMVVFFLYVINVERLFFVDGCEEGVGHAAHFDRQL